MAKQRPSQLRTILRAEKHNMCSNFSELHLMHWALWACHVCRFGCVTSDGGWWSGSCGWGSRGSHQQFVAGGYLELHLGVIKISCGKSQLKEITTGRRENSAGKTSHCKQGPTPDTGGGNGRRGKCGSFTITLTLLKNNNNNNKKNLNDLSQKAQNFKVKTQIRTAQFEFETILVFPTDYGHCTDFQVKNRPL